MLNTLTLGTRRALLSPIKHSPPQVHPVMSGVCVQKERTYIEQDLSPCDDLTTGLGEGLLELLNLVSTVFHGSLLIFPH
jgi:hypothetical protein